MENYINGTSAYNYGTALPYEYQTEKPRFREVHVTHTNVKKSVAKAACVYIFVLFVLLVGLVYSKVLVMQAKASVETMEKQLIAITEQNSNKKIQLEQSIDLKKIEEIAISQYGMQRPDNNQIIYVKVVQDDYGEVIKN